MKYAKRIDEPDTEHKAEFPELNDEEGDVETIGVEDNQLENCSESMRVISNCRTVTPRACTSEVACNINFLIKVNKLL